MKGAFFIVILIAMLIVGILTIKDMKTEQLTERPGRNRLKRRKRQHSRWKRQ